MVPSAPSPTLSSDLASACPCSLSLFTYIRIYLFPSHPKRFAAAYRNTAKEEGGSWGGMTGL